MRLAIPALLILVGLLSVPQASAATQPQATRATTPLAQRAPPPLLESLARLLVRWKEDHGEVAGEVGKELF